MKKIHGIIILILVSGILLFSGCFKVERNNIFDPDSSDFDPSAIKVKVYGKVFRGWSNQTLDGVRVEIGGQVSYTDEHGNYEVYLNPGRYSLTAQKDGWINEHYNIDVKAKVNEVTQREDISMFIWYEYWDYPISSTPPMPWQYQNWHSTSLAYAYSAVGSEPDGTHTMELIVYDPNDGSAYSSVWLDQVTTPAADNVYNITLGVVFRSGTKAMYTDTGFELSDFFNTGAFFSMYWGDGPQNALWFITPGYGSKIYLENPFTYYDTLLYFDFSLNKSNGQYMDMHVYDQYGALIYEYLGIYLGPLQVKTMDGIRFNVRPHDWNWHIPQDGSFAIYSVEFY
ncbi:MAG: carboxypeptidase-like regulatory domain-containing protein [bacterium]|nr:carboxypeptidase-like regulatory domain-containing protein [bacterium]